MNINYYNPYVREELMLYHHGVLGMKWGKQNGPPYPLAAGAHSASEKKAGWKKSLAGGAKAFGRGTVKAAKAIGRGSIKAAKAIGKGTNTALVRSNLKPKILMSEDEMNAQIQRLRTKKQYKNAMKGRFKDVTQYEKQRGEGFTNDLMKSIGKEVIIPTATGLLTYGLANRMAKKTGDKAPSMVETVFGKRVGFRDNERYISDNVLNKLYKDYSKPHLIEDTRKSKNDNKKDKGNNNNDSGSGNQQKNNQNDGNSNKKENKPKQQESKSSEAKAEDSKEEKRESPKTVDVEKPSESNTSPSPSKNSLSNRTRELNARVGQLYEQYNGGYNSKKIQSQIQKEKKKSGEDYSSIWKSTPPSVQKRMESESESSPKTSQNVLSQKMKYFDRLTNGGVSRMIPEYKSSQKYKAAYQKRIDSISTGDISFEEYLKRLSRY